MAKQTFLHDKHVALGAKMVDFAGWDMPVQYTSIIQEHLNVRNNVGIFDVSHMGEIIVQGEDALNFLNSLVPQDLTTLTDLKAIYCQLTNLQGGIIDDLIIYKLDDEKYLIIANASRVDVDINWMTRYSINYNVSIFDESHNYSMIAVQGPKASNLMSSLGIKDIPSFFSLKIANFLGINLWLSRTGYTGEDGFELIMKNKYAEFVWDKLLYFGSSYNVMPIGLGARDTLRLEAALHLYGNDLDESTTPIEAGLSWSVSKSKTTMYNGKEIIFKQLENGTDKKLVGLKMLDKNIARHGYNVFFKGVNIGTVTSGAVSPVLGENIALAYINTDCNLNIGDTFQIEIRNKLHDALIVKRPFVKKFNR